MTKAKIFVISGPSGVGKGTIIEALRKMPELNLFCSKSYTTRAERESDFEEQKYIFIDENKFHELEKMGEIIESNFYNNHWYGSSKSEIEKALADGKNVVKDIDVNGGLFYKKTFPGAVLIFIKSDLQDIERRLRHRGQNKNDDIMARLKIAEKELAQENEYHHSVINPEGQPEKAVAEIKKIIIDKI